MKLFHAILPTLAAFLLGSCIGDNIDGCSPENNLILEFRYYGDGQTDVFPANIHKADVFVFNETDRLVLQQSLDQASLDAFAGAKLSLSPGTYRVVCWGNVANKAVFEGITSGCLFTAASVGNRTINGSFEAEGGDPLYYGHATSNAQPQVLSITVSDTEVKTETVQFCCAHIRVEVYVKGFVDNPTPGQFLSPSICLTDIPSHYDFGMQPFGPAVSFRGNASYVTVGGEQVAMLEYYTPLFNAATTMRLLVGKQSDGSTVTTIGMADFIADNNITLSAAGETIISVLVEYKQSAVEITLPGWERDPVYPEL